jgi:peptidyl-prolyl cis-trans isomerase B (cyclophilin B)
MPLRRLLPLLALLLALTLAACGSGDDGAKEEPASATGTAQAETDTGCRKVEAPAPKGEQHIAKPDLKLDPSKTYVAQVSTNCGDFEITLAVKKAPKTTAAFTALARKGFFDGLTFHRVVQGFVIQGGDPLGNGQGGPGFSVREAPPKDLQYTRGVVAMAKTQTEPAGTSGSQFFVVTAEDAGLPPDYALLGRVTKGEDVVDTIGVAPTGPGDVPTDPIVIEVLDVVTR